MGLLALAIVFLLEQCLGQNHIIIDLQAPATCYRCDPHARHFPACLSEPVACHPDEVCSILYGNGLPTYRCQKSDACAHDVSHPLGTCTGGGVAIHPNQCELCCSTKDCMQAINGALLQEFPVIGGPVALQGSASCYSCDQHSRHFPGCLSEPVTCLADEVCAVSYGVGLPIVRCEKSIDCARDVSNPMRHCSGGGVEVQPSECQLCCSTASCLQGIKGLLLQEFPYPTVNQGLFCPGSCLETDIATCVHTATYCPVNQFCQVGIDDHLMVHGQCRNDHELQKCLDDKGKHPCVLSVGVPGHAAKCTWDCCNTQECLKAHFGAYMGSNLQQTVGPILTPAVTAAPSPVTCMVCDGDCPTNQRYLLCDGGYCSLTVVDSVYGSRSFKRGCATRAQCHADWVDGWSKNPYCLAFIANPLHVSGQDNTCSFCCTGDKCNEHITDTSVIYGVHA